MDKTLQDELNKPEYDLTSYQVELITQAFFEAVERAKPRQYGGGLDLSLDEHKYNEAIDQYQDNLVKEITGEQRR